jgi:DNA repair protein RecO
MKAAFHPVYIMHYRAYRETSMLLDVFSRDYGRTNLIAKGVKHKNKGTWQLLQPYHRLLMSWSGKSELMTLTGVESDRSPYILEHDRLIAGFYLNELVIRMLHQHEAHTDLFTAYDEAIELLANKDNEPQSILRIFEKHLLHSLGYGLILDQDVATGTSIDEDAGYYYQAERGPAQSIPKESDYIRISGRTLLALAREKMSGEQILHESKQLMRYILRKHLGLKPLASRELYASYLSMRKNNL